MFRDPNLNQEPKAHPEKKTGHDHFETKDAQNMHKHHGGPQMDLSQHDPKAIVDGHPEHEVK